MSDAPRLARIEERIQENNTVFRLRLRFQDDSDSVDYRFEPGQFNMLYLFGAGEVPISIASDPFDLPLMDHAIRVVGRVSRGLSDLRAGDYIGLRGPFGRPWPIALAEGRDIIVITGGLGCAPVVSVINYIIRRRDRFGRLTIMQGVKLPEDLIWRDRYETWNRAPDTEVWLAANKAGPDWPWHHGHVTELLASLPVSPTTMVMMCGPEGMMHVCIDELRKRGIADQDIYVSMERNMQCAVGKCGHCQYGGQFVCWQGPIFSLDQLSGFFGVPGI